MQLYLLPQPLAMSLRCPPQHQHRVARVRLGSFHLQKAVLGEGDEAGVGEEEEEEAVEVVRGEEGRRRPIR